MSDIESLVLNIFYPNPFKPIQHVLPVDSLSVCLTYLPKYLVLFIVAELHVSNTPHLMRLSFAHCSCIAICQNDTIEEAQYASRHSTLLSMPRRNM